MLGRLAGFLYAHRRAVLYVTVIGAVIAGVFGSSVAQHLSPYGANDPATQSVQATNRFGAAANREIDPGVVALVNVGSVHTATAQRRVDQVAAQLRTGPDVASVVSYYQTHNPAMVSRDGTQTYVLAYFRSRSDTTLKNDAQQIENGFTGRRDVKLGGQLVANAQVNTQVGHDLEHAELLAFPVVFLLSLLFFRSLVAALLPPLLGGLAILATFFALRIVASFVDVSVFALNLTTGLGLGLAIDYSLFMVSRYREESAKSGFGVQASGRARRHSADPAVRGRLRARHRLRRVPALADQGGARRGRHRPRRRGDRPRAHRSGRHRRGAAVRGGARRVLDVGDRVREGAWPGRGARSADRRVDHPRAARPVADDAARPAQLVGAGTAAASPRPNRAARSRAPGVAAGRQPRLTGA